MKSVRSRSMIRCRRTARSASFRPSTVRIASFFSPRSTRPSASRRFSISPADARAFTSLADGLDKGAIVTVPFGRSRRRGIVVGLSDEAPADIEPIAVEGVVGAVPPKLVDLALWLADYYGSTPARALELVAPRRRARRKEQAPPAQRQALAGEARPER